MNTLDITLIRDCYDNGEKLFAKNKITLNSGLTVLIGCNGCGKSTMLHAIKATCLKKNIPIEYYDNDTDGGKHNYYSLMSKGNFGALANMVMASEGERLYQNFGIYVSKVRKLAEEAKANGSDTIVLLCDGVDSGLSIDVIQEVKELFELIIKDQKETNNIDTFIIVTSNTFEMSYKAQCFDVTNSKYLGYWFDDYNLYKKFILDTRVLKIKRIEKGIKDRAKAINTAYPIGIRHKSKDNKKGE